MAKVLWSRAPSIRADLEANQPVDGDIWGQRVCVTTSLVWRHQYQGEHLL
jgi:hypothetical protein